MTTLLESLCSKKFPFIDAFLEDSFSSTDIDTIKNKFTDTKIHEKLQLFQEIYSL